MFRNFYEIIKAQKNIIFLGVVIFLFIYLIVPLNTKQVEVRADALLYHSIADAILKSSSNIIINNDQFGEDDIGLVIMPGYPFIVAIVYFVFGEEYINVIMFQIIISLIAILVYNKISQKLYSPCIAFLATLWLISYQPFLKYSSYLLIESLTLSLLIFSIFFIQKYFRNYINKDLYIFSLIFAVLISVNNRFIVHAAFIFTFLFILSLKFRKVHLRSVILSGLTVVMILLPWHIRQYVVYNKIILFSPIRTGQAVGSETIFDDDGNGINIGKSSDPYLTFEDVKGHVLESAKNHPEKIEKYTKEITREKYNEMKKNYHSAKGYRQYLSRFLGFFELYRADYRFGFGGDMRISTPNINNSELYKTLLVILFIFILLTTSIITYIQKKKFVFRISNCSILLILFWILIRSWPIIELGFMFFFMFFGIMYIFKRKNLFYGALFVLFLAHLFLHTYVCYIDRYRVTIIPIIFLLGWYGINELFQTIVQIRHKRWCHGHLSQLQSNEYS